MAVGLKSPSALPEIAGITVGVGAAGIRKRDRNDLAVLLCEPGTQAAGCFTRNRFQAAPVTVAREHLAARAAPRALVINSGNANAGTGDAGVADAKAVCRAVAEARGAEVEEVLPFSTGVIGQRLPCDNIIGALPGMIENASPDGWTEAAKAIMTTDTVPKGAWRRIEVNDVPVTITGIAKGSGMIRPDMATMLVFLATDARIPAMKLREYLGHAVNRTFNCITVDGDTSTNDACILLASGKRAGIDGSDQDRFQHALDDLCRELAQSVVRDGEGATKFVEVAVCGAASDEEARKIAMTVAHSPLVKTALFASDANWGRIFAAIGRAPVETLDVSRVHLAINGCSIVRGGSIDPDYNEQRGTAAMRREEIVIAIDLGVARGTCSVWTTDLSHEYVRINAEYRT
ncbi:MAG: Arginine biosynthesis bifunctional protein ArgJ [Gammaproteobacteria bacterium]|nr:Arginine biosynthesis bifunctional protein ArgJ [Gammaproteobacteria bacterium]